MSKQKNEEKIKSDFSLVRRIVAFLQLGEVGQLDSYVLKVEKTINRNIDAQKQNIRAIEFEAKAKDDEYKDKIEDAESDVENAVLTIDLDKIKSNQDQMDYMKVHLRSIEETEAKLKTLKENRADVAKDYKGEIDELKDKVKAYEVRLKMFVKK